MYTFENPSIIIPYKKKVESHISWEPLSQQSSLSLASRQYPAKRGTRQLRKFKEDQMVHREVYKEVPPKVEYPLTP
ncbi:winged helix-turn-helix transcriptional regulator [Peribacillus simplex]|uniref:Winged helix-turn-helix transcriptional regulator n=1 Tax=Peribacillus simplex TaxID=1478 RepID=A0A8B5Y3G7_9BACI|nr:winged helix-turn-helix transcriptional regulator [Peribacillus simplex]